ncbi:two-component system chemotaxis response regulator CheB [Desulfitispora alkaliphila]|uniref:protein-glutamate methylesterase/protein-glutamine glutaminase n=1 Tax=Desulfitispora alkaliphila TaxID=622674 RepID=UPI003D1EAB33
MQRKAIKVLIVDDSALVREVLGRILSQDHEIEVVGTAIDPLFAIKQIKEQRPDVITLDLEMPRMDGLTFLEKLMSTYPIPVVVISSLAQKGSSNTIKALELGAVDFVSKPKSGIGSGLDNMSTEIVDKVKGAANVNMNSLRTMVKKSRVENFTRSAKSSEQRSQDTKPLTKLDNRVIAIGASTGGTVAVKNIITNLPSNIPGVVVVLHMPATFTASYAEGLNSTTKLLVKEAEDGDRVKNGCVYIAPGGKHLLLRKNNSGYFLSINDDSPVNRHKPSVDKTFHSVAQVAGSNSVGVILTGMGDDGAKGLKMMRNSGAYTIAQDEKSSIIFGMPKKAIALNAAAEVHSLDNISSSIVKYMASIK